MATYLTHLKNDEGFMMTEDSDLTTLVADMKLGDALECINAFNAALGKHGKHCLFRINDYKFRGARLPDGPNNRRDLLREISMMYGGPLIAERMSLYGDDISPLFDLTVQQLEQAGIEKIFKDLSATLMEQAFDELAKSHGPGVSRFATDRGMHIWHDVFAAVTDNTLGRKLLTPERSEILVTVAATLAENDHWFIANKQWIAERLQAVAAGEGFPHRPSGLPDKQAQTPCGLAAGQSG